MSNNNQDFKNKTNGGRITGVRGNFIGYTPASEMGKLKDKFCSIRIQCRVWDFPKAKVMEYTDSCFIEVGSPAYNSFMESKPMFGDDVEVIGYDGGCTIEIPDNPKSGKQDVSVVARKINVRAPSDAEKGNPCIFSLKNRLEINQSSLSEGFTPNYAIKDGIYSPKCNNPNAAAPAKQMSEEEQYTQKCRDLAAQKEQILIDNPADATDQIAAIDKTLTATRTLLQLVKEQRETKEAKEKELFAAIGNQEDKQASTMNTDLTNTGTDADATKDTPTGESDADTTAEEPKATDGTNTNN